MMFGFIGRSFVIATRLLGLWLESTSDLLEHWTRFPLLFVVNRSSDSRFYKGNWRTTDMEKRQILGNDMKQYARRTSRSNT